MLKFSLSAPYMYDDGMCKLLVEIFPQHFFFRLQSAFIVTIVFFFLSPISEFPEDGDERYRPI